MRGHLQAILRLDGPVNTRHPHHSHPPCRLTNQTSDDMVPAGSSCTVYLGLEGFCEHHVAVSMQHWSEEPSNQHISGRSGLFKKLFEWEGMSSPHVKIWLWHGHSGAPVHDDLAHMMSVVGARLEGCQPTFMLTVRVKDGLGRPSRKNVTLYGFLQTCIT